MIITFEGIDGSGKSTQVQLLADYLRENGKEVITLREPGNTEISESIRAILLDKKSLGMTARAELLLFLAARAQLTETVIRPALAEGKLVLCDRFIDSSVAYQAFGRGLDRKEVENGNKLATNNLIPDITFYLALNPLEARVRLAHTSSAPDRMELAGSDFFERVHRGYEMLSLEESTRIVKIDSLLSIDEIHQRIVSTVISCLK